MSIHAGIGLSVLFVLIASSWAYWAFKERKLIKLREKFFEQNGGNVFKNQRTSNGEAVTIFKSEELERATKKFGQSLIIDQGRYGMVFKGELPNYGEVTIKKYNIEDKSQIVQFINEVTFLCQINHTNVVKLLGCCLETPVPFLVYEFISNGASLFQHIHEATLSFLSLERRLRIASETAGALAFLHSQTMPIFHRDVKSTNILLDSNLTAKVADFGASGLVPLNNNQVNDMVKETLGYLDPEYFYTGQLTEKSDVYSLGVVLVELLTGKMPICLSGSNRESITLPVLFTAAMRENHLSQVLEKNIADEGGDNQLMEVAQLAVRCLSVKGEERPTMTEVESELNRLRTVQPPGGQRNYEERHDLPTNQLS